MFDFAAARRHMVDSQVRPNDVTDLRLQAALELVPREVFLPSRLKDQAYVERELEYSPQRRLIAARDFAKLVSTAAIGPNDVVLDVACGGGYSAAVLSRIAGRVVGTEEDGALASSARKALSQLGYDNVEIVEAGALAGAPDKAPYDVILIAAAATIEPLQLVKQLREGGRLALIRRDGGVSRGVVYTVANGVASARTHFDAATSFVLPEFEASRTFAF